MIKHTITEVCSIKKKFNWCYYFNK